MRPTLQASAAIRRPGLTDSATARTCFVAHKFRLGFSQCRFRQNPCVDAEGHSPAAFRMPPSAILCLTYTKAAASEMSNRVFQRLGEWAVLPDDELARRVEAIEGERPDAIKLAEARRLFAKALETPGGLKIQTIHAFCEALLHQFRWKPMSQVIFQFLDDTSAYALLTEAKRSLLTATSLEAGSDLAAASLMCWILATRRGWRTCSRKSWSSVG